MPSSVAHAYIARDVYKKLDKRIKQKIKIDYLEDYKTYAQGPDIFYFYKIITSFTTKSKKIRNFGHTCHDKKVNDVFITLTNKVKISKDTNQFLYLIGLTTHYLADSIIHPYINYKSVRMKKKYFKKKDAHFLLETYFDNYMINKEENINYKKFKVYNFCFNLKRKEEVVNLLNETFKEVFNQDNMGEKYFKGVDDAKKFFKYVRYDPIGYKKYFYKFFNIFLKRCFRDVRYLSYNLDLDKDVDYLNLNHDIWYNLDDKTLKSKKSLLDLYGDVVSNAKEIIEKLYDYVFNDYEVDLEKLFGNKSYGSGLPLK